MRLTPLRHLLLGFLGAWICLAPALAEELSVPGSGNSEHVLSALADAFNAQQRQVHVTVPPSSGTAGALRDVEAGVASLGRVGRPLNERARGLTYLALGRDAVIFVGGAGVTARSLTTAQTVEVYRGSITDWRELGGKPGPIRLIGREASDASLQAIEHVIKPFASMTYAEAMKTVHLDPQMIELLDRFPTSLGYLNRSALQACKTAVVLLALDGVAPTPQNVELGRYPIWLEFGLVYRRGQLSSAAQAFVGFMQSASGQAILRDHGVLPSPARR
jgi:phosphate transport system substrate-binding protein